MKKNYQKHEDLQNMIFEQTNDCIVKFETRKAEIFEAALRVNATPPIKGDITQRKLKIRGIYIMGDHKGRQWLEQNGKRISDIIKPEFPKIGLSNGLQED